MAPVEALGSCDASIAGICDCAAAESDVAGADGTYIFVATPGWGAMLGFVVPRLRDCASANGIAQTATRSSR